jgi:hypothetical protein
MNLTDKLLEIYPDGQVSGLASVIVGDLNFTVEWANLNHTIGRETFMAGVKIPIHEVKKGFVSLQINQKEGWFSEMHFKGFEYLKQTK